MDSAGPTDEGAGKPLEELERPIGGSTQSPKWGSDAIAATIRALDIPFIALVPGSSFRGLHDSIVNHLGNRAPQIVVCLHEEHAVAIADGYARVTGKPMAVALHSNVGLMHALMPIYNAWCDRMPMLIFGATGPVDAHKRRPWIDWVHTSRDQGALVRPYVKWDDQPASAEAAVEAVLRANQITTTPPFGPTYICLDVTLQEEPLEREIKVPQVARFAAPHPPTAPDETLDAVVAALKVAERPVLLFGRMSRSPEDWKRRVDLAEALGAVAMTSMHNAAAFPTNHAQHLLPPCGEQRSRAESELIARADLIISFDWLDLAGYLRSCTGAAQTQVPIATKVVHCSLDALMANGWSMDHQAMPAADINILAHPDLLVAQLLSKLTRTSSEWDFSQPHWTSHLPAVPVGDKPGAISIGDFAMVVRSFGMANDATFVHFPLSWPRAATHLTHPLGYLGKDGGAAVGVGPGHAVGAALALRNSERIVTAVLGDGDTLMGITALWTASHLNLPMLVVVANNTSYFNDELHQERVARTRGRPVENRWIGQRLTEPEIDITAMARAQGFDTEGPVSTRQALVDSLACAAAKVKAGGRVLIDARIEAGYANGFGEQKP